MAYEPVHKLSVGGKLITVEVRGAKELIEKLRKLGAKKPALLVCKALTQQMVETMKSMSPYWRGNLQKSIQSRLTSEGYNIHMLAYGAEFETGHEISPVDQSIGLPHPEYPLLTLWAISKLANWKAWLTKVFSQGYTVPPGGAYHMPFIQPSIDATMRDFDRIAVTVLNKTLRESGFL